MKIYTGIILELLRAKQWAKNLLIFGAIIFAGKLLDPLSLGKVIIGFFLFSFAASALYIFNDIKDYKEDRVHPAKKSRPIASGAVTTNFAAGTSVLLLIISLSGAFLIDREFFFVLLAYSLLSFFYSLKLKHVVILDIFIVSAGFVLRAISGAYIISVEISEWLLICTSLLALFVIMGKRRYEIETLSNASKHRKILDEYSVSMLDQMISVVTAATVIAYSFYTFLSKTAGQHGLLMLTIPFVLYGIFRYLYLIHKKKLGGAPETIFLKDLPTIINILLWTASSVFIVYFIK